MNEIENITTPVGDLEWVFITGKGKKDLNDNDRFVASLVLDSDSDACKEFREQIETYWEANKPKKAKACKSLGFRELEDEEGNSTGRTSFNFWTGIVFPTGDPKTVKVFNAKGAEVALGDKKIGNGSRGRIKGAMGIYDNGPAAMGVTLYLNGIQLTKFVPFTGGVNFDAVEDDDTEETFEGFEDEMLPVVDDAGNEAAKPRL